ncbi:MAG: phosphomannomutase/phosphoglucomutase [Bryobacteraceae bacterium]
MRCFRECDIRGTYPDEIDEGLFRAIGIAITKRCRGQGFIVAGHDVRLGSPSLSAALIEGMVWAGGHVVDLGRVPTPVVYFARRQFDAAAGVMVTASHNPRQYNGLKLLFRHGPATCQDIADLKRCLSASHADHQAGGRHDRTDALEPYAHYIECCWRRWSESHPLRRAPRLVVDPGHGAWSQTAGQIMKRFGLGCRVVHDEPDGRFPDRSPDCAAPGTLARLAESVRQCGADAGLAWDGDGDRLAVVDGNGIPLTADQIGLLLASSMPLRDERVLLDVKMSRKAATAIEDLGGISIMERSAHCALERTMIEQDCLFGCEYSGHYFFRELHGADDGFYAAVRLVHLLGQHDSLDSLLARLPAFHVTPDIRVPGGQNDFTQICGCLRNAPGFGNAHITKLDGEKLDLPDGWILVRRSVSEDKLSVRVEGETAAALARIVHSMIAALPANQSELRHALETWNSTHCRS